MNKYERAIILAAKAWWKEHRPVTWTIEEHRKNPTVNSRYTPAAKRLAKAVAKHSEKVKS